MKNCFSSLFAFLVVWLMLSSAQADFLDISSPLLREALDTLEREQVVRGYPDLTFRPAQDLSRAEALKLVFRVGDRLPPQEHFRQPFPDVEKKAWYAKDVARAAHEGIVSGYPDGTFRPHAPVNRAEFIKMTMRSLQDFHLVADQQGLIAQYQDLDIEAWYLPYLAFAYEEDYLELTSRFRPTQAITRGEAALIMSRVLTKRHDREREAHRQDWLRYRELGFLSCDHCAGGKDLNDQPWVDHPLVQIEYGQLYIDGENVSQFLTPFCESCITYRLTVADRRNTPLEQKFRVDQDEPELYERAIGIHGGAQTLGTYQTWEKGGYVIKTAHGIPFHECDCEFERTVLRTFRQRGLPVLFEDWIRSQAAKALIYDSIDIWRNNLKGTS